MKKIEIRNALNALKKIKMPKIEDKDLRNAIIKDHFALLGESKKYDAAVEDFRTAYLGAYEAELAEVQKLQDSIRTEADPQKQKSIADEINSHKELFDAIHAFEKAVDDLGKETVEVELIEGEKFIEEYQKQDYDFTVVEALYPMFK